VIYDGSASWRLYNDMKTGEEFDSRRSSLSAYVFGNTSMIYSGISEPYDARGAGPRKKNYCYQYEAQRPRSRTRSSTRGLTAAR
jgi:hypothetical protein